MMDTPTNSLTREVNDTLHTSQNDRSIRYMDTATAYDLWSEVYDTDGNFLQALDNLEMEALLPRAIAALKTSSSTDYSNSTQTQTESQSGLKAIDLGCGTGRNTIKLLDFPAITDIVAVDLSPKMLEIARQRCLSNIESAALTPVLAFHTYDMIATPTPPAPLTQPRLADLIISTLVLEHVPLTTFFSTVSQLLRPGGILLLTNMHSEMGKVSQAGFVDPKTGDKIRPMSYSHTVLDTVEEARHYGLEVVKVEGDEGNGMSVKEVKMGAEMIERLGVRSKKWIGIDVWFGGLWRKDGPVNGS